MTSEERREAVREILAENPQLSQRAIASRLNCSQTSVRRAVAQLWKAGALPDSVAHAGAQGGSPQVSPRDSEVLVAALNAELAAAAEAAGEPLEWSAAEADTIAMIAAAVDRRSELSAAYAVCEDVGLKLKIATELRLLDGSISRLYRQVSTEVPAPRSLTSQKASRAAHSRWDRERLKEAARAT